MLWIILSLTIDFKALGLKSQDWALAGLAVMAKLGRVIRPEMLRAALEIRFKGKALAGSLATADKVQVDSGS